MPVRRLGERGYTLPLTDVLIASLASRCGYPVLTTDKDFNRLPVEVYGVD